MCWPDDRCSSTVKNQAIRMLSPLSSALIFVVYATVCCCANRAPLIAFKAIPSGDVATNAFSLHRHGAPANATLLSSNSSSSDEQQGTTNEAAGHTIRGMSTSATAVSSGQYRCVGLILVSVYVSCSYVLNWLQQLACSFAVSNAPILLAMSEQHTRDWRVAVLQVSCSVSLDPMLGSSHSSC